MPCRTYYIILWGLNLLELLDHGISQVLDPRNLDPNEMPMTVRGLDFVLNEMLHLSPNGWKADDLYRLPHVTQH